jgi:hypothetical protein
MKKQIIIKTATTQVIQYTWFSEAMLKKVSLCICTNIKYCKKVEQVSINTPT